MKERETYPLLPEVQSALDQMEAARSNPRKFRFSRQWWITFGSAHILGGLASVALGWEVFLFSQVFTLAMQGLFAFIDWLCPIIPEDTRWRASLVDDAFARECEKLAVPGDTARIENSHEFKKEAHRRAERCVDLALRMGLDEDEAEAEALRMMSNSDAHLDLLDETLPV